MNKLLKLLPVLLLGCSGPIDHANSYLLKHKSNEKIETLAEKKLYSEKVKLSLEIFKIAAEQNKFVLFYYYDNDLILSKKMNNIITNERINNILKEKYIVINVDVHKNPEMLNMLVKSRDVPSILIVKPTKVLNFREESGFFSINSILEILKNPFND